MFMLILFVFENLSELVVGELISLVRIENFRHAIFRDCLSERFHAKLVVMLIDTQCASTLCVAQSAMVTRSIN